MEIVATDWNCPKHLAHFEFNDLAGGATEIKVFPNDTSGDLTDLAPSETPFFRAVYKPTPLLPRLPLSTSLAKFVGIDLTVVQPPVPQGRGSQGELVGSDGNKWCRFVPTMASRRCEVGWFDLRQYGEGVEGQEGEQGRERGPVNFWPGMGRWQVGVKMLDADISFVDMVWWDLPGWVE